ncbi:PaaI family thioesterase [Streptomyces liangshanensis]|uniref:PaaI family thioesterase n=1 Tax=Streptomyces liangshanensis TaxID=2717324 RepID=A0A6G9GUQ1_9ACTN|nr:PaaI family thioesterase [Streptomyces liangshanensis]QIQ01924.1 PaaI family thioesterase [Streptomyces liangshanensis]
MPRSRTYTWEDPGTTASAVGGTAGLEFMRDVLAGRLPAPPFAATLGTVLEEVGPGHAVFTLVPGEEHYNPLGTVHGGVFATLLDSAAGCAVHTLLPAGMAYTSLDLTVKFLRPVTAASGRIRAVGSVLSSGRRTALAEARMYDAEDRLLAHATSSCMIFPAPASTPASAPAPASTSG